MAKRAGSDEAVLAQIPAARRRARATQPAASEVRYERVHRRLRITLTNGTVMLVPIALIPRLRGEADRDVATVAVGVAGISLRWERLDEDLSIAALAQLAFGRQILMRASGAAGGSSRTRAKAKASRANGLLGGRPRGTRQPSGE